VESEHHIGIGQHYFVHCGWIFEAIVCSHLADDLLTEVVSAGGEDGLPRISRPKGRGHVGVRLLALVERDPHLG
jgi:hypothetical protein